MSMSKETSYTPVGEEDEVEHIEHVYQRQFKGKNNLLKTVFLVQLANLLIGLLLYALWLVAMKPAYSDLPLAFNTTRTFDVNQSDLQFIKSGTIGNEYWGNLTILNNNGLVTVSKSYAERHNLELSGLPAPPDQTVFQVDVFHQLHCLHRLRGFVTGFKFLLQLNPDLDEDEPYIKHTMHCVDYLRQAVMCQSDMTLVSTTTNLEFDKSPPRQCRDFEAVRKWVMDRRYDYQKYLNGIEPGMAP